MEQITLAFKLGFQALSYYIDSILGITQNKEHYIISIKCFTPMVRCKTVIKIKSFMIYQEMITLHGELASSPTIRHNLHLYTGKF